MEANNILSVPEIAQQHVGSFLPFNEKLIYAVAIINPLTSNASDASVPAIMGIDVLQIEQLDFATFIGRDTASRLTDVDISDILLSINAVNSLKVLKLTNCLGITGSGLEPLRGSAVLEVLDLSLVGTFESPILEVKAKISTKFVLPILDSILKRGLGYGIGNSLKWIQFPHHWSTRESFNSFKQRYNNFLLEDCHCPVCRKDAMSYLCCYQCLRVNLRCGDNIRCRYRSNISFCQRCTKHRCNECSHIYCCQGCNRDVCSGCLKNCDQCKHVFCIDCSRRSVKICSNLNCGRQFCTSSNCRKGRHCENCNKALCRSCDFVDDYRDDFTFYYCTYCKLDKCHDCGGFDDKTWKCRGCNEFMRRPCRVLLKKKVKEFGDLMINLKNAHQLCRMKRRNEKKSSMH